MALAELSERRLPERGEQRSGGRERGLLGDGLPSSGGEVVAVLAQEGRVWAILMRRQDRLDPIVFD